MHDGPHLKAVEIKSATTFKMDRLKGLRRFRSLTGKTSANYLVYNGEKRTLSDETTALNFREVERLFLKP